MKIDPTTKPININVRVLPQPDGERLARILRELPRGPHPRNWLRRIIDRLL